VPYRKGSETVRPIPSQFASKPLSPQHGIDASLRAIVGIPATSVVTGHTIRIEWEVAGQFFDLDAYLVVGLPEAMRFRGDGFIALPPNARAPRSITSNESTTRLIVPLNFSPASAGLFGVPTIEPITGITVFRTTVGWRSQFATAL
jgi:hypothetical protein